MRVTRIPHFSQVTDEAYFKSPLLSNSECSKLYAELNGLPGMRAKAATLRTGTLLHLCTYQPADFEATPEFSKRILQPDTKANLSTINQVQRMARAAKDPVAGCPVLRSFLANKGTRYEMPVAAYLQLAGKVGVYFKVKPDAAIYNKAGKITYGHDLKSTAASSLAAFLETFTEYGYWRQAYSYKLVTGAKNWFFTGVSKSEPHRIFTVNVKDYESEIQEAKRQFRELLEMYLQVMPGHARRCQRFLESIK